MSAKTVGYARVSTEDQHLDAQIMQLEFAACDKIFTEKASGADRNRPQLTAALRYLQRGDTLIVCKMDRIARNTKDLLDIAEQLEARGVIFRILNINIDTGTATGKMMLTILGAVATFERDIMLERQAEGIKQAQARGAYKGKAPVIRDAAAPRVLALRQQGIPHRDIAAEVGVGIATVYRICKQAQQAPSGIWIEPMLPLPCYPNPDAQSAAELFDTPTVVQPMTRQAFSELYELQPTADPAYVEPATHTGDWQQDELL